MAIQVNPNLTLSDKVAAFMFFGVFAFGMIFSIWNCLNRYRCENFGTKCFWCKKHWVGRGCGCIPRWGAVGASKTPGSEAWQALDLDERIYHLARFSHRKMLEARRVGKRTDAVMWVAKRDAYLTALRNYMECRRRGIYR